MPQTTTLILLPQTVSSRVTTQSTGVGRIVVTNPGSGYVATSGGAPVGLTTTTVVPAIYFDAIADGNNQQFTDTRLSTYSSNADMSLYYNGSLLENNEYALSGNTLTVNTVLNTGDQISLTRTVLTGNTQPLDLPPTVTISGVGIGATAQALVYNGSVADITVVYPGQGYTQVPTVTISPPAIGGTQATAVAYLNAVVYGTEQPAASYYLANQPLQTLTWMFSNVTATITIQASLVTRPTADGWFNVQTFTANSTTETSWQNIAGNFVWIRAVVQNFTQGTIQYIKVTY